MYYSRAMNDRYDPFRNPRPVYLQIANAIQARIQAGEFTHLLPAERDLASHYGVSHQTLRRGIHILRERGIITTRQGHGTCIMPPDQPGTTG